MSPLAQIQITRRNATGIFCAVCNIKNAETNVQVSGARFYVHFACYLADGASEKLAKLAKEIEGRNVKAKLLDLQLRRDALAAEIRKEEEKLEKRKAILTGLNKEIENL